MVLAVDVGTTSAKAQRFEEGGRPVGAAVHRSMPAHADGTMPAARFVAAVNAVLDAVHEGPAPDAVALSAAWHGLVGVDGRGRATTDISTWLDMRATTETEELLAALRDPERVRERTGAPLHPSLPPARLAWFRRHDPAAFAATTRWCTPAELLELRWFGDARGPSTSMASGRVLDDAELQRLLGVDERVLAPPDDEPRAGLVGSYAKRWPQLAPIPWFPALGDGACAIVGSDAMSSDRAALTVGTSAAVRVLASEREASAQTLPRALFRYLLDSQRAVVGAARSAAGNVVEWAGKSLRVKDGDLVTAATSGRARVPGAHGLRASASLAGERSPDWPVSATGWVRGMTLHTSALDVVEALVESTALGLADAVVALETWAGPRQLILSGGAARSPGWRHLLAEVLGRELIASPYEEVSARGAALVAFERLRGGETAYP